MVSYVGRIRQSSKSVKLCYEVGDFGTNSAFVDYISLTCLIDLSL